MEDMTFENIEVAPKSVVLQSAREFAAALAETPQFKNFEQVAFAFRHDQDALMALSAYRTKVEALRAVLMLNAASDAERAELEQLKNAYVSCASAQAYAAAEAELRSLCQQAAAMISEAIGLNYAAACGSSCCG